MLIEKIQERLYVKKESIEGKSIRCTDYILEQDEITSSQTVKEFGAEKSKLVIQPLGVIVMEFLEKHFNELFNYLNIKYIKDDFENILNKNNKYNIGYTTSMNNIGDM